MLDGGDGNDALDGGAGTDLLIGGSGDDAIAGGDGADHLLAGDGADSLHGDAGADTLDGGDGNDTLDGGQDNDTLIGGAGEDTMSGGDGNDHLSDGAGLDHVDGGTGDDVILLSNDLQIDIVDGGEGQDTLDLSANAADAIVDLQDGLIFLNGIEEAHIFEIESIVGSHGRNTLVANDAVNVMVGGGGNDIFVFRSLESLANHGGPRDLIMDFQIGDRIDLSRISDDSHDFASQKLFFTGAASAAPADLGAVTFNYQMLDIDHEVTVVSGNLDSDPDDEFSLVLDGHHELTAQDFILEAKHEATMPGPALATA
jgi:Ca2+-binding RTX toxin-like protein